MMHHFIFPTFSFNDKIIKSSGMFENIEKSHEQLENINDIIGIYKSSQIWTLTWQRMHRQ